MEFRGAPCWALALVLIGTGLADAPAAAVDRARISGLGDVAFGVINATTDQSTSQSVCAFSTVGGYSVVATGSGSGGAFTLTSGSATLPYDVLWSASAGQTGGTTLVAGTAVSGLTSLATHQTCNSGPSASASLTIRIRSADLISARAGSYSGTLQITIAPE